MKKLLLIGSLAFGAYALFFQGNNDEALTDETGFRELTDAEAQNYLNQNNDLFQAFGKDLEKAKNHWRDWGYPNEFLVGGRVSPYLS